MNSILTNAPAPERTYRFIDLKLAQQIVAYELQLNPQINCHLLEQLVLELSANLGRGQACLNLNFNLLPQVQAYQVVFQAAGAATYANQPLVLAHNKLYVARYYFYEQDILAQIQTRITPAAPVDLTALTQTLAVLFPPTPSLNSATQSMSPDWQKIAAASACLQGLTLITGGPGTGKTTTVTKLLSALLQLNPALNIALAAPTGKAAARMTESIRSAKQELTQLLQRDLIPEVSHTLHRLLGWHPQGFRYQQGQLLPYDCVVVDEASMIDLPLMRHLLMALAPTAKLILLGDQDQLASVEVGSVLADLCDAGTPHGFSPAFAQTLAQVTGYNLSPEDLETTPRLLQNSVAQLRVSYRFHANSGIGNLARAVNSGAVAEAAQVFTRYPAELTWIEFTEDQFNLMQLPAWHNLLKQGFAPYAQALNNQASPSEIFAAFNQFQILVALRKGMFGLDLINSFISSYLQREHLLPPAQDSSHWFIGRPVMISANNYDLGLFNGDLGITLMHAGQLKVAFQTTEGGIRWLLPSRLPAHETAFAITVHKSQGSEFSQVALLLPTEHQQVISKELIYTALTRAKHKFTLLSNQDCWHKGIQLKVERASGLRDILWPTN